MAIYSAAAAAMIVRDNGATAIATSASTSASGWERECSANTGAKHEDNFANESFAQYNAQCAN